MTAPITNATPAMMTIATSEINHSLPIRTPITQTRGTDNYFVTADVDKLNVLGR